MSDENETRSFTVPFVRSAYNYDRGAASLESGLFCPEPTMTDQSMAEECDINTIVERFGLTGQLPENLVSPHEGDFTDALDYQQSLNLVILANKAFMELPAKIRARFGNDADEFVQFTSDPANLDECRSMGLADPVKLPVPPMEVRIVADPTQVVDAIRATPTPPTV